MMGRLACGLDLLLWGSGDVSLEDLPPHGSETWQWFISSNPKAMRAPLVADPKTEAAFRMLRCRDDDVFVCSLSEMRSQLGACVIMALAAFK